MLEQTIQQRQLQRQRQMQQDNRKPFAANGELEPRQDQAPQRGSVLEAQQRHASNQ
jgi:hypothetical protein